MLETLKLHNGSFPDIVYHNRRLNKARKELFGCTNIIDIAEQITIPEDIGQGIYKCTLTYNTSIVKTNIELYKKREMKSLKIVHADDIEYSHKYADRSVLNKCLALKDNCDEIVLVKNGMVTDTSFSNIVFYDGAKWFTPKNPLLKGTKRERLLDEGRIEEENISMDEIKDFEKAALINCMLNIGDTEISIGNIVF